MRRVALIALIATLITFVAVSFTPASRFATWKVGNDTVNRALNCHYQKIYKNSGNAEVLFFGASRTRDTVKRDTIAHSYRLAGNEDIEIASIYMSWSNPDLSFFMLRDYLQNNPAPKLIMIELMDVAEKPAPIRYVHPWLPALAPLDLYTDLLRDPIIPNNRLFAASDVGRLLIEHVDISLTNLLSAEGRFLVPKDVQCRPYKRRNTPANRRTLADQFQDSRQDLVDSVGSDRVGDVELLRDRYRKMKNQYDLHKALEQLDEGWESRDHPGLPIQTAPTKARDLLYYQRMVSLAEAFGVQVQFYAIPFLFDPPLHTDDLNELEHTLGAPIMHMPQDAARVSYHFYRDRLHPGPETYGLYAAWYAGGIAQALRN